MQKELRGLSHRADKQQHGRQRQRVKLQPQKGSPLVLHKRHHFKERVKLYRPSEPKERDNSQRKAKIAHTIDNKGLDGGSISALFMIPKSDEQVRAKPHPFPAKKEL